MLKGSLTQEQVSARDNAPDHRLQFLDVVRGIAALAVVLEHGSEQFFPGYLKAANSYFTLGVFGVSTFFLVSGFIIPVSIERHNSLSSFWKARFFRLYPMYWFSIFAGLVFGLLASGSLPTLFGAHPWFGILVNMTMFQNLVGVPNFSGLYWTLGMEMIFYLLCSCLFLGGVLSRSLVWVWLASLTNLAATLGLGLLFHRSLPAGRTALLISAFFGTLLYRHYRGCIGLKAILGVSPILALSLLCGFWFRFHQFPTSDKDEAFRFTGVALSYVGAYLLFGMLYWQRKRRFPAPLLSLGRISYSLYLMHPFVFAIIPSGDNPVLRLMVSVVIAIMLASATFVLIEQPSQALHRTLSRSAQRVPLPSPIIRSVG